MKAFARHLKQERELHSWSQEQVAETLGATTNSVSRWERGITFPGPHYRQKLCEIFGKTAQELGLREVDSDAETQVSEPEVENQRPASSAQKAATHLWNLPHRRLVHFTGREAALSYLHRILHANAPEAQVPVVAISGLGGMGKSELALEYVYQHSQDYQAVFWIHADTADTLLADLAAMNSALNLTGTDQGQIAPVVREWLNQHTDWLVILDNLEEFSLLHALLPFTGRGHVIVTTRSQATGSFVQQLDLSGMEPDEGNLLLLRRAKRIGPTAAEECATSADRAAARVIAHCLDGLPLALDQAGAYVEEAACSLAHYSDLLQSHQASLLGLRNLSGNTHVDHPHSLSLTLSLTLERIAVAKPEALDLLYFCSFLHPDAIPEEIFVKGQPDMSLALQEAASDPVKLDATIAWLRKYSLLRRNPETQTLSMHRLVQAVVKGNMDEMLQQQWATQVVKVIYHVFPQVEHWITSSQCHRYFSHAQICADLIEQWNIDCIEAGQLLTELSSYLWEISLFELTPYARTEPLLTKALAILTQQGADHPAIAEAQQCLGWVHYTLGNYTQAESYYQQALAIHERAPEPDYRSISGCLNDLGEVYEALGNYALAEPLYQRALSIDEMFQGTEHFDVTVDMLYLGECYCNQKKYAQAQPLLRKALEIRQKIFGKYHPTIASAFNVLGRLYLEQGLHIQAEPLLLQALEIRQQLLKPSHPHIAVSLNMLATLYLAREEYARAESLLLEALEILQKTPESARTAEMTPLLNNLARLHYVGEDFLKAEQVFQQAGAMCQAS